jgi:hypothetical protein
MVRLMLMGEVASSDFRDVQFRVIASADINDYPNWVHDAAANVPTPPSAEMVASAFQDRRVAAACRPVDWQPRRSGESTDEFYRRVADAYRILGTGSGKPVSTLASVAGVNRSTASQWVHQARKRGHLPPTTTGKVSR